MSEEKMGSPFIHEKATVETKQIGQGTRIWANCHILPGAQIGNNCNIGEGVYIENRVTIGNGCTVKNHISIWEGVTLEDSVFIGPNVTFTNDLRPRAFFKKTFEDFLPTLIKKGATIGANATIICGATIGEFAFIGAGAVVTEDVPPHALILGVPGKIYGKVCFCAQTLQEGDFCPSCLLTLKENSLEKSILNFDKIKK